MKFIKEHWKTILASLLALLIIYEIYKTVKAGETFLASLMAVPKKLVGWLNPFGWFSSSNVPAVTITPGIDPLTNQPTADGSNFYFGYPKKYYRK